MCEQQWNRKRKITRCSFRKFLAGPSSYCAREEIREGEERVGSSAAAAESRATIEFLLSHLSISFFFLLYLCTKGEE